MTTIFADGDNACNGIACPNPALRNGAKTGCADLPGDCPSSKPRVPMTGRPDAARRATVALLPPWHPVRDQAMPVGIHVFDDSGFSTRACGSPEASASGITSAED